MSYANGDALSWYVVHTHPKQEDRTASNLRTLGIETVNPKWWVNRYNEFSGKKTRIIKPLFPGYIFSRFKYNEVYHKVRFTRGVHSLVSFSNGPMTIDEEIVDLIQSRIGSDGFVKMTDDLKPGDEVVIKDGRFQNLYGVFESDMQDADRVRILLTTVGFQAHVVVDRAVVNKVSKDKRPLAQPHFAYSA